MSICARAGSTASYWTRPVAAWSTRLINKSYYGALLRVRRSSDNTELDIGFDVNGDLDTAALLAFVGANNGFVSKWYDQFPHAFHGLQPIAANQSKIVNAGVLNVDPNGGRPALAFDNTNNYYLCNSNSSILGALQSNFAIVSASSCTTKVATPMAEKSIYYEGKILNSKAYIMQFYYIYGGPTFAPSPRVGMYSDDGNAANASMAYSGSGSSLNKTYVNTSQQWNGGNDCIHWQNGYNVTGVTHQSYNFNAPIGTDVCMIGSAVKDVFVAPHGPGFIEEVRLFKTKLTDFQKAAIGGGAQTYFNTSGY